MKRARSHVDSDDDDEPVNNVSDSSSDDSDDSSSVKKRKPQLVNDDDWMTVERRRLVEQGATQTNWHRQLYAAFHNVQLMTARFKMRWQVPELVVVGMQSDGKSSFIEALLGFQFNVVESNIGTRRPLIIQMSNNPEYKSAPYCRFRKKNHLVYDQTVETKQFEHAPTPVNQLSAEIRRRTNEKAGDGDQVSDEPIILRVEYAHCSNLTIYDTPGFRLRGDEKLRNDIERMVLKLIAPEHRIIVCLEQSTTEWSNTTSRPIVQRVDPNLERTVLIQTKFDNRIKELQSPQSANKYLQGELSAGVAAAGTKPFFISLPLNRELKPKAFQRRIEGRYMKDMKRLKTIGFDEERFREQIGFCRAKAHLEALLMQRYQQACKPTLHLLEQLAAQSHQEHEQVQRCLAEHNLDKVIEQLHVFIHQFDMSFQQTFKQPTYHLKGDSATMANVQSLQDEEMMMSGGAGQWPSGAQPYTDQQQQRFRHKIYGVAQYCRLTEIFKHHSEQRDDDDESHWRALLEKQCGMAAAFQANVNHRTVADWTQQRAEQVFKPLLAALLCRMEHTFKNLFAIIMESMRQHAHQLADREQREAVLMMSAHDVFCAELQRVYAETLASMLATCRAQCECSFATLVANLQLGTLNDPSAVCTVASWTAPEDYTPADINSYACEFYKGFQRQFINATLHHCHAQLYVPVQQYVCEAFRRHFRQLSRDQYETLLLSNVDQMKAKAVLLEEQCVESKQNRDAFVALMARFTATRRD
jgi:hypothetical protein